MNWQGKGNSRIIREMEREKIRERNNIITTIFDCRSTIYFWMNTYFFPCSENRILNKNLRSHIESNTEEQGNGEEKNAHKSLKSWRKRTFGLDPCLIRSIRFNNSELDNTWSCILMSRLDRWLHDFPVLIPSLVDSDYFSTFGEKSFPPKNTLDWHIIRTSDEMFIEQFARDSYCFRLRWMCDVYKCEWHISKTINNSNSY